MRPSSQVPIDSYVTAEWSIDQNWSIKTASLWASAKARPRAKFTCRSVFPDSFAEQTFEKAKTATGDIGVGAGPIQSARRQLNRTNSAGSRAGGSGGRATPPQAQAPGRRSMAQR